MTEPRRPRTALDLLDEMEAESELEREIERVEKLSPAELDAELRARGLDPERADALIQQVLERAFADDAPDAAPQAVAVAPVAAPAPAAPPVASLAAAREKRRSRTGWVVLAAAAVVLLVVGVAARDPLRAQIDAWLRPPPAPAPSLPPVVPPVREETPAERAARLREEAYADLLKGYLGDAEDALDDARALDPAGEADEKVAGARRALIAERGLRRGYAAKPGLAPFEAPLKRTIVP